jgi:3-phosphoshikimate 1-carboxyvinyltransferase
LSTGFIREDTILIKKAEGLKGEIDIPGDKSISHRAVMLSAIADGKSRITNLLPGEDVLSTRHAFEEMGVRFEQGEDKNRDKAEDPHGLNLIVHGAGMEGLKAPKRPLDLGNSGTAMRLLAGILAGQKFSSEMVGDESLTRRPMRRIIEPLTKMGAEISGTDKGTPPIHIQGRPLHGIRYQTPVASAQVKSCILLAGLYAQGLTEVIEPLQSRDHTERMLKSFGAKVDKQGLAVKIEGGQRLSATSIQVPGDISSAAFFMVAGLIVPHSEIVIRQVGINPTRSGILDILKQMGADINLENQATIGDEPVADVIVRSSSLKGISIGAEIVPRMIDEFPVMAVAASLAEGRTEISGAEDLRVKESDRISSVTTELKKMGARIEEKPDGMIIRGVEKLTAAKVKSHGDHRLAMALCIAGLACQGETGVQGTRWINTSFPGFSKKIKQLVA